MTDLGDARDEEKLLECAICRNRLNAPRRLDCRHIFCFTCIKLHYKKCGKRFAPCPICRKLYPSIVVPIENLPQCSFPLHQLLDMKNSRHSCEACPSSHAPFLCLKCKKWLCFTCKEAVDETASCPNHEAYRIADMDARLYNIVMSSQDKTCIKHPNYELQWFCKQCNMLGCKQCLKRQPLTHRLIAVDEKASELRELFKDVCGLLNQKATEHEQAQAFFNQISENLSPLGICNVEFCEKATFEHKENISECKSLIKIMTYLEEYGSSEVLVAMYLNMEDQIASEIDKQPLQKLPETKLWLGNNTKTASSSGGTEILAKLSNQREAPADKDLSKKISVTYYCNLMALLLVVVIGIFIVLSIGWIVHHRYDLWEDMKIKFYMTAVDALHSRLDGILKDIFTPDLLSRYVNFTKEIETLHERFMRKNVHLFLDFLKHVQDEYCDGNVLQPYGTYGGDIRFRYSLNISTICRTDW